MTGRTSPSSPIKITRAKKNRFFTTFFLLLTPVIYPIWLPWIGKFLVVSDPLQPAEALVILAGDENERIAAGAQLFQQGVADWFILTDMRLETTDSRGIYSTTVKRKSLEQGVPADRILIVPGLVSTTYEEVVRLKEFSISQGFRCLIVVTSPYHTRRARWLLRGVFRGSGVNVIVSPAWTLKYNAGTWWKNPVDRMMTITEYGKILAHLIGCRETDDCNPILWEWVKNWQKRISPD